MKISLFLLSIICSCLLLPLQAIAQQQESGATDLSVDFAPPDLSAFTLLGVAPEEVARPGEVKELSIGVLSGSGDFEKIASSFGIEWSPTATLGSDDLASYRKSRLWRNWQVSFATAALDSGAGLALGFRWVPIDMSDPAFDKTLSTEISNAFGLWDEKDRLDAAGVRFENRVRRDLDSILANVAGYDKRRHRSALALFADLDAAPINIDAYDKLAEDAYSRFKRLATGVAIEIAEGSKTEEDIKKLCNEYAGLVVARRQLGDVDKAVAEHVLRLKEQFRERSWNATVVHFATGVVSQSPTSTWDALRLHSWSSYAGAAIRVMNSGQFILHGQLDWYTRKESKMDLAYSLGTRLLLGGSDKRLNIELAYEKLEAAVGALPGEKWHYTVGGEIKLTDQVWLELAVGGQSQGLESDDKQIVSRANIKYGLSRKVKVGPS